MVEKNHKSIKQELKEVQRLILENQYLQEKYPERKFGLELGLQSLRDLESEMFEALKQEKLNQKLEVYEIHLDGVLVNAGAMPMEEYGEFLINSQKLITSLADKPLSVNGSHSKELRKDTELEVYAHCSGSLKIMLISKQFKLVNDEFDTPINNAFIKLNEIANFEGDISELGEKEDMGKRQILDYKNLLRSLSSMNLDMEIKKPMKDKPDEVLCNIDVRKAYKIFRLIDEKPKPEEIINQVTGIVKAVDLEKHSFKIESTYGDETKIIRCDFDKKYEEFMIENFNNEITVEFKKFTEEFIDRNSNKSYELLRIIN